MSGFTHNTGLLLVASTVQTGYALESTVGTYGNAILTWQAPDDGRLHAVLVGAKLHVTTAMTGGLTGLQVDETGVGDAWDSGPAITSSEGGTGWYHYPASEPTGLTIVGPGALVWYAQSSALTAGLATVYAQIWAA